MTKFTVRKSYLWSELVKEGGLSRAFVGLRESDPCPEIWMTTQELAAGLGKTRMWVSKMMAEGMPHFGEGTRSKPYMIDFSSAIRWLLDVRPTLDRYQRG